MTFDHIPMRMTPDEARAFVDNPPEGFGHVEYHWDEQEKVYILTDVKAEG